MARCTKCARLLSSVIEVDLDGLTKVIDGFVCSSSPTNRKLAVVISVMRGSWLRLGMRSVRESEMERVLRLVREDLKYGVLDLRKLRELIRRCELGLRRVSDYREVGRVDKLVVENDRLEREGVPEYERLDRLVDYLKNERG